MKLNPAHKFFQINRLFLTILVLLGAELFLGQSALAQSAFTWNGGSGTTGNWNDGANWGGSGPATPQAFLNFANSTRLNNTNNFTAGSAGFQIYFKSGAGTFNLYGNSISFFDFSSVDPNIQNEGAGTTQTINFPIVNGNTHGVNGILNINLNASPAQGPLIFNGSISNLDATIAVRALNISGGSPVRFNGPLSDFSSSGKLALTQLGGGPTTLAATNTYTGATTINAGTLTLANSGLLGSGSYAGAITITSGATFEYSGTNAQTLSGAITGAGAVLLDSTNAATLTLSSTANSYGGVTTVSNLSRLSIGTTSISSNTAFNIVGTATGGGQVLLSTTSTTITNNFTISGVGYTDAVSINAGAIRMSAGQTLSGLITLAGNSRIGAITGSQSFTILSRITGGFGLDIFGAANANSAIQTFTLANTGTPSDYTGNTTLYNTYFNNGFFTSCQTILRLGANEQIPNGAGRGIVSFTGNGASRLCVLELNGFNETVNGINNTTAGPFSVIQNTNTGASVLAIGDGNTNSSFSGTIADGGVGKTLAIVKIGSGTLALSGTNTYIGGTTNSAGTLEANSSPSPLGGGLLVMNGGALSNNVSATLTNNINLAVNSTVGVGISQTLTLGGVITNTGSLTKEGAGTLSLTNINNYSGGTVINSGSLSPRNAFCFGTGTVAVNTGGQVFSSATFAQIFTNAVTLNGGQLHTGGGNANTRMTWSGPVTVTASSSVASDGGTIGNTFTGGVNLGNSGYTLTLFGNGNNGLSAHNFNSVISGGPNAAVIGSSSGLVYLNAANTFSGTNRSGYSMILQNVNALQNATLDMNAADTGSVTLINNAVIGALTGSRNLNLSVSSISIGNNNASTTFSGALTNTGSMTKIGSGTLTLSGANTYTGRTTVSSGTLALSGSGSLASSVIAVAGGATLDISAVSFTLGAGQVLSNTASATAQLVGPLSSGAGTISVSFVNGTPSFNVTGGALNLSASTSVAVRNTGATLTPGTYKIISASVGGSVSGTAPTSVSVINGPAAGTPSVAIVGGELYLTVGGTVNFSYGGTSFTYNGAAQAPAISYTGSTGIRTTNYVGTGLTTYASVNAPTNVGSYYLSNTVAADANYFGATNSQSFTINAAALGITANNTNKNYGQTVTFAGTEFTASGLVGGDSVSSLTLTSAGATNTATVGSYAIVASAAVGTSLGNYTITYTNGSLTVNQAATSVGVSSTANPSGFKDGVAFLATLPADAAGSVVFASTNDAISTNTISSGTATSLSITNLPRGTNVITIAYLGDSNYLGSTNSLNQVVTNHLPVAINASYTRSSAFNTFKFTVTNLLSNASDVDGDSPVLVSVGATTNSAMVIVAGDYVLYYSTNALTDGFTYTVSDGFGGTNTATVTINVDSTPLFGQSQIVSTSGGTATLNFAGIPGYSYSVSRSTNLVDWAAIWTTNAPVGGVFEFIDTSAPTPSAYYQLQFNP